MGKLQLSKRANWESTSGKKAEKAEQNLYEVFEKEFKNTKYILYKKPTFLKDLYANVKLDDEVLKAIYNPNINLKKTKWGICPDFAIQNKETGKILFGEIKRQDGWVEGKNPSAGRGNAHERFCKFFTPGLLKACRKIGKIKSKEILPFWVVFEGDVTRDPKRVREITFLFDKYNKNFFMWRPNETGDVLINHFNKYLKKYLD